MIVGMAMGMMAMVCRFLCFLGIVQLRTKVFDVMLCCEIGAF